MKTRGTRASFLRIVRHVGRELPPLYASCGVTVKRQGRVFGEESQPLGRDIATAATVIWFSAATVRGSLMLLAPPDEVRRWQKAHAGTGAEVGDVLGEFSNMLLGRLKLRLLLHGVSIQLSTPLRVNRGQPPPPSSECYAEWLCFRSSTGPLAVRVEAVLKEPLSGVRLAAVEETARPGRPLMF